MVKCLSTVQLVVCSLVKFTGGIPSSGSDNVSRFATGSDGSIIDLGFTTTNEEGETVFLTTGDGVVVDSNNYWYTTGHFK